MDIYVICGFLKETHLTFSLFLWPKELMVPQIRAFMEIVLFRLIYLFIWALTLFFILSYSLKFINYCNNKNEHYKGCLI